MGEFSLPFNFMGRMLALCLLVGEMIYVYYFVLLWRRPTARLLALLLLLPPSLFVPWQAPTGTERILYCFVFIWNMGSKLLLLVWDRGPAADPGAISSFPKFFSAMAFSVHMRCEAPAPTFTRSADSEDSLAKSSGHGNSDLNGLTRRKSVNGGERKVSDHKPSDKLEGFADDDLGERSILEGSPVSMPGNSQEPTVAISSRDEDSVTNGLTRRKFENSGGKNLPDQQRTSKIRKETLVDLGERSVWHKSVAVLVNSQRAPVAVLRSVFFYIMSALIVRLLLRWRHAIPGSLIYVVYFFSIYFTCLFIFEAAAGIPALALGFQLHPQFNMPFLATSLGDFWGRRWNRLVNNLLRASVYEPILQWEKSRTEAAGGLRGGVWKPSRLARGAGISSCFLVSGLMHELLLVYLVKAWPTFEMTMFFVVHGIGVIVEMVVMKSDVWARGGKSVPVIVRWAFTMGFVWATSAWLFFPPVERCGMVDATVVDFGRFYDWIERTVFSVFKARE